MDENFIAIIEKDIQDGHDIVEKRKISECNEYHRRVKSKYAPIIDGFDKNLHDLFYDDGAKSRCLDNIKIMVEKLEMFRAMGYKNIFSKTNPHTVINNSNSVSLELNVTFEQVRKQVEEMSALTDSEVEEILKKVNELEEIVSSKDRKTKKWERAKDIIKWVADKGVDVGIALLPLLLQIK